MSLWELLEEEWIIAHKLACSCDRHNIFCQFLNRVRRQGGAEAAAGQVQLLVRLQRVQAQLAEDERTGGAGAGIAREGVQGAQGCAGGGDEQGGAGGGEGREGDGPS